MKEKDFSQGSSATFVKESKRTVLEFTHIPSRYNETIITTLVRDPQCIYIYWDLSDDKIHQLKKEFGENVLDDHFVLRVVEAHTQKEQFVDASFSSMNWYLQINNQEFKTLFIEMGIRLSNGNFFAIARSNIIKMPADTFCLSTDYKFGKGALLSMESLKFILENRFSGSSFNSCGIVRK